MTSKKPFPISICIAGGVSAGSYSAGAMDELLDNIALWYSSQELPDKPNHKIKLKGFSGASAGSIQAILSIKSMLTAVDKSASNEENNDSLSKATWTKVGLDQLLTLDDLKGTEAQSLLNSSVLRDIALAAVEKPQWVGTWPEWIAPELKLRCSITGLRGVPYSVNLPEGNAIDFGMSHHNEYVSFTFTDANGTTSSLDHHIKTQNVQGNTNSGDMALLADTALASAAFPLAFRPIQLIRKSINNNDAVNNKQWLFAHKVKNNIANTTTINYSNEQIQPKWQHGEQDKIYSVDGGTTNNEPLIEAYKILFDDEFEDWYAPSDKALGNVLFIDPFPNPLDHKVSDEHLRLDKTLATLITALQSHTRFSEKLLTTPALKNRTHLLYPNIIRQQADETIQDHQNALKSSALGGFGGFIKDTFRNYDYELGRINMRFFLREEYTLPADHELFTDWKDKQKWIIKKDGENHLPIIPVYEIEADSSYKIFDGIDQKAKYYKDNLKEPENFKFTLDERNQLRAKLIQRIKKVGLLIINHHKDFNSLQKEGIPDSRVKRFIQSILWTKGKVNKTCKNYAIEIGWRLIAAGYLGNAIMRVIEQDLSSRDLLEYKINTSNKNNK